MVVITADRGFAGAYNTNVLRIVEDRLRSAPKDAVQIVALGRKGRDYLARRRYPIMAEHTDLPAEASIEFAREMTDELTELFVSEKVDRVELVSKGRR